MTLLKRKHQVFDISDLEGGVSDITLEDTATSLNKRACYHFTCNFKIKGNILCGKECENFFKLKSHIKTHSDTYEYRLSQIFKDSGVLFQRNFIVDSNENEKRFLDFVVTKQTHNFIIKCEKIGNSCSVSNEIAEIHANLQSSKPIVWIFFNSGVFHVDELRKSKSVTREIREKQLLTLLENFVPTQQHTVFYMYYDSCKVDGKLRPIIFDDKNYKSGFENCSLQIIVD